MEKKEIKHQEKVLINNVVKINSHLLKNLIYDEDDLIKTLSFYCKHYLLNKGYKITKNGKKRN